MYAGQAWCRASAVDPLHPSPPTEAISHYTVSFLLRSKAMSTGVPLVDDLATFKARLDGLCTGQNPDDRSNALQAAFEEPGLYDAYVSSLDAERARELLEVFDKVCPMTCAISRADSQHHCTK